LSLHSHQLTKLWESEKNMAKSASGRLKKLEETLFTVQLELKTTNEALEISIAEKNKLEKKYQTEESRYSNMSATYTGLADELIRSNREKRDAEEALKAEKEKVLERDKEIQDLKAEMKRIAMLQSASSSLNVHDGEKKQVTKLQQQLKETQEELKKEKKKNAAGVKNGEPTTTTRTGTLPAPPREKPTMTAYLPDVIVNTKPAEHRILTRPTAPPPVPAPAPAPPRPPQGICFDGVGTSFDSPRTDLEDRVALELSFLESSYDRNELTIEPSEVTRILHLPLDRENEEIIVHLILSINAGYPETTPLGVDAIIWPHGSTKSVDAQKVATDAIPALIDTCRHEANASLGTEAVLPTLQAADKWVNLNWASIQSKRLSGRPRKSSQGSFELCRLLVSTHYIHDADRIHMVTKTAGKYDLGGYVKTGRPGYILVEGLHDNCQFFLETLAQQQQKVRESRPGKTAELSTFSEAGKKLVTVEDFDNGRVLPRKMLKIEHSKEGMAELERECTKVGLSEFLKF